MMTETQSSSASRLIDASRCRTAVANGSSVGPYCSTAASRLLAARLQAAWASSPISGHVSIPVGGGGTRSVPWLMPSVSTVTASAMLVPRSATGPMMIASSTSVRTTAASRRAPPSRAASQACTGCSATARITDQITTGRNGATRSSDQKTKSPSRVSRTIMSVTRNSTFVATTSTVWSRSRGFVNGVSCLAANVQHPPMQLVIPANHYRGPRRRRRLGRRSGLSRSTPANA